MSNEHTRRRRAERQRHDQERDPEQARPLIAAELRTWNASRQYIETHNQLALVADDILTQWLRTTGGTPNGVRGYTQRWLRDFCGYLESDPAPNSLTALRQMWSTHLAVLEVAAATPAGRPPIGRPVNIRLGEDLLGLVDAEAGRLGLSRAMMLRRIVAERYETETER